MNAIIIDKEKCIGCGLCKNDCVGMAIEIINDKAVVSEASCIKCGHCEAICPRNAITLSGFDDKVEEFEQQTRLDPEQLLNAIKSRRTIRQFTNQEIPEEILDLIIESGRLAPTGTNSQGTSYLILKDKKAECEAIAVKMFRSLINAGKKFVPLLKKMTIDDNFFFKKAPLVIVILGKDKVSSSLAAQNMAFMAEANGLGVLFSGFFTLCHNINKKIRKLAGSVKYPKAVTTLVIGYPNVKYYRTVHRKTATIIKS